MFIHFEDDTFKNGLNIDKIAEWGYAVGSQTMFVRYGDGASRNYHGYQAEAIYRLLITKSTLICEEKK